MFLNQKVTLTSPSVGFPRGLFHYTYGVYWREFFEALGITVVESPETTQKILDDGVKEAVSEACIPIKVYHGHVRHLAPLVDYLFLPRYVSMDGATVFCPKFLGLPEMVKSSMAGIPPLLSPRIDTRRRATLFRACAEVGRALGERPMRWLRAWQRATEAYARYLRDQGFRRYIPEPHMGEDGPLLRIAVTGYPYEIYDGFLNLDLLKRLAAAGVEIITPEMFGPDELSQENGAFEKGIFWHYSDRAVKAGLLCFHRKNVDGVIHITAFGCGPDAIADKVLELEASATGVPFMPLLIDEYSGEAGLVTRLEAFLDMVKRSKGVR